MGHSLSHKMLTHPASFAWAEDLDETPTHILATAANLTRAILEHDLAVLATTR